MTKSKTTTSQDTWDQHPRCLDPFSGGGLEANLSSQVKSQASAVRRQMGAQKFECCNFQKARKKREQNWRLKMVLKLMIVFKDLPEKSLKGFAGKEPEAGTC